MKELLRIMDYLAKPFGTQEDLLITYGLAPADYTIGPDGNPDLDLRRQIALAVRALAVSLGSSVRHVLTRDSELRQARQRGGESHRRPEDRRGRRHARLLLARRGASAAGKQAEQAWTDGSTTSWSARDPISKYDQLVKDWQNAAGNKIKQEYNDAIAAAASQRAGYLRIDCRIAMHLTKDA